mgnify:CR=1 FL=1
MASPTEIPALFSTDEFGSAPTLPPQLGPIEEQCACFGWGCEYCDYPPLAPQEEAPRERQNTGASLSARIPRAYRRIQGQQQHIEIESDTYPEEVFLLRVPETAGAGDEIIFLVPKHINGIVELDMITKIIHCQ